MFWARRPNINRFLDPVAGDGEEVIQVHAAGLHPIVKARASGAHYSSDSVVPLIPGVDGVGTLNDGNRVFFGFSRAPFGSMAERTVTRRSMCVPLPDGINDVQAAAIANPGMSAWLAMKERGKSGCRRDGTDPGSDGRGRATWRSKWRGIWERNG